MQNIYQIAILMTNVLNDPLRLIHIYIMIAT